MTFHERRAGANKHPWTLPQLSENDELTRPIAHAPPGNYTSSKPSSPAYTMGKAELARRKSDYFEEAFSMRGGDGHPLRDRIRGDSIVMVELKTNVIIGDEFIFITELSAKLAERYHRPVSSIAVNVQHSQCLFFAGTFEPAYTATVSALADYVQPTTNRRNVYVLSEHLEDALGVPTSRGFFTFVPLAEDNVACSGKTVAQALDEVLDSPAEVRGMSGVDEERLTRPGSSRKKRLSVKSLSNIRTSAAATAAAATAAAAAAAAAVGGGEITPPTSADDLPVVMVEDKAPPKVARRRKSFVTGLFARNSNNGKKENERQVG